MNRNFGEKYNIFFDSFAGKQYKIAIYEAGYSSTVTTLKGAGEPITTNEDNDNDIFMPVRKQSGYIRVIDETANGSLMEDMIPDNSTQLLVRLIEGTYINSIFTPITNSPVRWQGFVSAEAFTQEWHGDVKVIEIPVKSILAALEDVTIDGDAIVPTQRLVKILIDGLRKLLGDEGTISLSNIYINATVSDDSTIANGWMTKYIQISNFVDKESVSNEGSTDEVYVGKDYLYALEETVRPFGIVIREMGTDIFFSCYDSDYVIQVWPTAWQSLITLANANTQPIIGDVENPAETQITSLSFEGAENRESFMTGARKVSVNMNIGSTQIVLIEQTKVTEDSSPVTVLPITYIELYTIFVQKHSQTSVTNESFSNHQYTADLQDTPRLPKYGNKYRYLFYIDTTAEVSEQDVYNQSIMRGNVYEGGQLSTAYGMQYSPLVQDAIVYTGAIPVRFYAKSINAKAPVTLQSGIWCNFLPYYWGNPDTVWDNQHGRIIYMKSQQQAMRFADGYLNIRFRLDPFYLIPTSTVSSVSHQFHYLYKDGHELDGIEGGVEYAVYAFLHIHASDGTNYYWTGSTWSNSDTDAHFPITIIDGKIETNKDATMLVDGTDGIFVPVTSNIAGSVTFGIYDVICNLPIYVYETLEEQHDVLYRLSVRNAILSNLAIEMKPRNKIASSDRTSNNYMLLLSSGFSADKTIKTVIGTFNNNRYSQAFITDYSGKYIERIKYNAEEIHTPHEAMVTAEERPEIHLLNRMQRYYAKTRRVLDATIHAVATGINNFYTYSNRRFVMFLSQRNWREDRDEVTWIEASDIEVQQQNQE